MFCKHLQQNEAFPVQHEPTGFINEGTSVYCAVRTGSLNTILGFILKQLKSISHDTKATDPFSRG